MYLSCFFIYFPSRNIYFQFENYSIRKFTQGDGLENKIKWYYMKAGV